MTAALWDATLVSRLHPETPAMEYVIGESVGGIPVRVAAPAILEVAFGRQRRSQDDRRSAALLSWFTRLVASDALTVVPLDGRAAVIAGRLRAIAPHPSARTKRDARSKSQRAAAWLLDIEIAAIAFAAGLSVATENRGDFEALADALVDLFPGAPPLRVLPGPLS